MKLFWGLLFLFSSAALIFVMFRRKMSWSWFWKFALHLVVAAGVLYVINEWEVLPTIYIPINPITIGTLVVLGVPGVALLAGLQWVVV